MFFAERVTRYSPGNKQSANHLANVYSPSCQKNADHNFAYVIFWREEYNDAISSCNCSYASLFCLKLPDCTRQRLRASANSHIPKLAFNVSNYNHL